MMFISYFKVPIRNSSVTLNVMHSILLTGGNRGKSTYAKKTFNEQGHQLKSYDKKFEFHFFCCDKRNSSHIFSYQESDERLYDM